LVLKFMRKYDRGNYLGSEEKEKIFLSISPLGEEGRIIGVRERKV